MRAVKLDSDDVTVPQRSDNTLAPRTRASMASRMGPRMPSYPAAGSIKPLKVLVAEDDAINRTIIQKRLQIDKHTVHLSFDGSECFEEYSKNTEKYDVILMDMQMPILDGMGAAKKIRDLEKTCYAQRKTRIPIVAVSASLAESQAQEAVDAGIDGWILKPVDFGRLRHLFSGLSDMEKRKEDYYEIGGDHVWTSGGWLTLDLNHAIHEAAPESHHQHHEKHKDH